MGFANMDFLVREARECVQGEMAIVRSVLCCQPRNAIYGLTPDSLVPLIDSIYVGARLCTGWGRVEDCLTSLSARLQSRGRASPSHPITISTRANPRFRKTSLTEFHLRYSLSPHPSMYALSSALGVSRSRSPCSGKLLIIIATTVRLIKRPIDRSRHQDCKARNLQWLSA